MPVLSFNVNQNKFDQIQSAIGGHNASNPEDIITTEDEFAKRAFQLYLRICADRVYKQRLDVVQEQLKNCSPAVWGQITGLLV